MARALRAGGCFVSSGGAGGQGWWHWQDMPRGRAWPGEAGRGEKASSVLEQEGQRQRGRENPRGDAAVGGHCNNTPLAGQRGGSEGHSEGKSKREDAGG